MKPKHFESLYPSMSRFKEIEEILTFIKNGNSCQLVSFPGTGRSNILQLLTYNREIRKKHLGDKQKYVHFVYMNFSEVKNKSLHEVNKFIFLSLIDSLTEREFMEEQKKISKIFKEYVKINDELTFFQGIKEALDYLSLEKKLTIILLFDRFEEYLPNLTDEFFANLRILRNRLKYRLSAVFSLNRPLEETLSPNSFAQFYEFLAGHLVFVLLYDKIGIDFRVNYLENKYNQKINNTILQNILFLTSGHGKLARIAFEEALEKNLNSLSKDELIKILLTKKNILGSFSEIWSFLTPNEKKMLLKNESSNFLENIHLTKAGKISIPLFKEYLLEKQKDISYEEKITYDEKTNEIKRGEENLSDKLTSSEFKLLKYLLQNSGKVIERNEIIETVWQENSSIAGVSDQALDQLVSRIRKKIENDPNNPRYIVTIKGRGVKLNS